MKRTTLLRLGFVLLTSASATAQDVLMFPRPILDGALADVNGDGIADLVGLGYESGVTVRLGHGNGTFGAPTDVDGPEAFDVVVGDVTGDGKNDILTVRTSSPPDPPGLTLDVYVAGDGSFGAPMESPVDSLGESGLLHSLADMNADGRLDWVAVGSLPGASFQLTIATATGSGSFVVSDQVPLAGTITAFALADFDADGKVDAATANSDALAIDVRFGVGDGTLGAAVVSSPLPSAGSTLKPHAVAGDFDGDGSFDLVTSVGYTESSGLAGGLVAVMQGQGNGAFVDLANMPIPSSGFAEISGYPALGDVDGDTLPDVVVGGWDLYVFLNEGACGLKAGRVSSGGTFLQVSLVDLDGDGVLDARLSSPASCALGTADGSFVGPSDFVLDSSLASIASADMNLDGTPDLVSANKTAELGLAVALANGDGTFTPHYPVTADALHLACGDLDGDGAPDIVLTHPSLATAECLFNDGSGTQFPTTLDALDFAVADVQLADVDADGNLDLLATHTSSNEVIVRRGDGAGGLLAVQASAIGSAPTQLGLGDMDGDGTIDVTASLQGLSPSLSIANGLGNGLFAAPQAVPLPDKAGAVVIVDLNGDAIPDIATVSKQAHSLFTLSAQAPGQFSSVQAYATPYNPSGLASGDLDLDGRPDVVVFRNWSTGVAVFQNLGGGVFAERQDYIGQSAKSGALGDFNGDGRTDIAAADSHITILPNVLPDFPSLGYQHDGGFGFPHLVATGTPAANEKITLTTTGVPSPALALLFAGFAFAPQPFKGGTLVPSPSVAVPVSIDIPLVGRWPAEIPAGTAVFFQEWFATAGAQPAATNAVMAVGQ